MKTLPRLSAIAVVLLAASSQCMAMMDIEFVDKPRAKALGMQVSANGAGPGAVRIVLEFEVAGELKSFKRVDLQMYENGKLAVYATLQDEGTKPGHIIVSCAIDRAKLGQ